MPIENFFGFPDAEQVAQESVHSGHDGDVRCLQVAGKTGLPLLLAQRIHSYTLLSLTRVYNWEISHTDLKHNNIIFDVCLLSTPHSGRELGIHCSDGHISTTPTSSTL